MNKPKTGVAAVLIRLNLPMKMSIFDSIFMEVNRQQSLEGVTHPYFKFGTWNHCAYCGAVPGHIEHAMPLAFIGKHVRKWLSESEQRVGPQTPSCSSCNRLLSSYSFYSFEARCEFVSDKIRKQAIRVAPDWSDQELAQLKDALRNYVSLKQDKRTELLLRWKWFRSDAYYFNLENLLYEPLLCITDDQFNANYHEYFASTISGVQLVLKNAQERRSDAENDRLREESDAIYGDIIRSGDRLAQFREAE